MQMWFEHFPKTFCEIFGRWNNPSQKIYIHIEVPVIHLIENLSFYDLLQLIEIHDHPRLGIDISLDRHLEIVIVSMAVGVRAFPIEGKVLLIGPVGPGKPMSCSKLHAYLYQKHVLLYQPK
jgi:hypothetical protein